MKNSTTKKRPKLNEVLNEIKSCVKNALVFKKQYTILANNLNANIEILTNFLSQNDIALD